MVNLITKSKNLKKIIHYCIIANLYNAVHVNGLSNFPLKSFSKNSLIIEK